MQLENIADRLIKDTEFHGMFMGKMNSNIENYIVENDVLVEKDGALRVNEKIFINDLCITKSELEQVKMLIGHTHSKSEIKDLEGSYANPTHTHSKTEVYDFAHTHSKTDINDFAHTHSKTDINNFAHNHNSYYYPKQAGETMKSKLDKITFHNHAGYKAMGINLGGTDWQNKPNTIFLKKQFNENGRWHFWSDSGGKHII